MNLSSCQELKQEVLQRSYRETQDMVTRGALSVRGARAGRKRSVAIAEHAPVAAVGVAPVPGKKKDFKLAVRIFAGCEHSREALLKGMDRFEGEMDIASGVRYRPRLTVSAGGSCGHYKITAGTLGGFVEDDDRYYIMSNNHILANSNQCFGGDRIMQPGPLDANAGSTVIGHLDRWHPLSIEDSDGFDVAIAHFSGNVDSFLPWDYTGIGTIRKNPVANRYLVTRVIKRGRTTGVRRGRVSAFELYGVRIDYGTPNAPAIVTYDDQIEIVGDPARRPFSAPGDSGSFIIDRDTLAPYALLYGGGSDSLGIDRTLAQFMPDVLNAMGVRLVQ